MLQPKQTKFRKMHKGRNRGLAQNGNTVAHNNMPPYNVLTYIIKL